MATRHGLDPLLVQAMVTIESAGNPWAMRYEPGYTWLIPYSHPLVSEQTELTQQRTSWGLMQVMGATARELGCDAPYLACLCAPAVGLEFGCRYLARQLKRYDGDVQDAVAAYNAGSARRNREGQYVNEAYVRKVWRAYEALTGV